MSEESHREFLLSALRAASLRAKMWDVELTTIGIALKSGMVGADEAVRWLKDVGALDLVGHIPPEIGVKPDETMPMR